MRRRRAERDVSDDAVIRRFGRIVVFLRIPIVLAWIALLVGAVVYLPPIGSAQHHGIRALVPPDSRALRAEIASVERFGYPLLARTLVVQRDPEGLSPTVQARAVARAVALTRRSDPELDAIVAAVPVTNTLGFLPSASEEGTTALTYLFFEPGTTVGGQEFLANKFLRERFVPEDSAIGVTGSLPGRLAQARQILGHLGAVEALTVLVIAVIVGLHFRSIGAPLLTLAGAGIAFILSVRLLAWGLVRFGGGIPEELEPLMVVLLLGIVTDYSIFFLEHARRRLRDGASAADAARLAASEISSIIVTAGIAVGFGTLALLAAEAGTYRALGPGLALAVFVGLAVSVTFVPATIALFGRRLFWPSLERERSPSRRAQERGAARSRFTYAATSRWVAVPVAIAGVAVLGVVAWGARSMQLGFSLVGALPTEHLVKQAALAAGRGFAPGIISPSMVTLEASSGSTLSAGDVAGLQDVIEEEPGVAGVIGPREVATLDAIVAEGADELEATGTVEDVPSDAADQVMEAFVTPDGAAARLLVVLEREPLGAPAIAAVEGLRERLPQILSEAGLRGVDADVAGDTALAADTIDQTMRDLRRVGAVVLILMLLLLMVYLRAVVAPFYLLAVSVLAFFASLSITAFVFREVFGIVTTSFFVPFASAVLLISLGSDYNIFLVGRVWNVARGRPLREAIAVAAPDASRAIGTAGVTLAASFAVLAIVPIVPMRQFAFAMAVGILLDTFFVRAIVVPALVASVGPASAWPGRFRRPGGDEAQPPAETTEPVTAA